MASFSIEIPNDARVEFVFRLEYTERVCRLIIEWVNNNNPEKSRISISSGKNIFGIKKSLIVFSGEFSPAEIVGLRELFNSNNIDYSQEFVAANWLNEQFAKFEKADQEGRKITSEQPKHKHHYWETKYTQIDRVSCFSGLRCSCGLLLTDDALADLVNSYSDSQIIKALAIKDSSE